MLFRSHEIIIERKRSQAVDPLMYFVIQIVSEQEAAFAIFLREGLHTRVKATFFHPVDGGETDVYVSVPFRIVTGVVFPVPRRGASDKQRQRKYSDDLFHFFFVLLMPAKIHKKVKSGGFGLSINFVDIMENFFASVFVFGRGGKDIQQFFPRFEHFSAIGIKIFLEQGSARCA